MAYGHKTQTLFRLTVFAPPDEHNRGLAVQLVGVTTSHPGQ